MEKKNNEFKQELKKGVQEKKQKYKNDNNIMHNIGENARIALEIIKKGEER